MLEARSGRVIQNDTYKSDLTNVIKEKFDKLKPDLLSESKEFIHLEVEKAMKKQKGEFKSAIDKLQEYVIRLEQVHDDF